MTGKNATFIDNSPPAVDATWLNIIQTEQNNVITTSGQSLNDSILTQQASSIASYAAQGGVFCNDSGAANAYVLTQISPFIKPFALKNGFTTTFRAGNPNSGPSTVNVMGFGAIAIKQSDGITDIAANSILTTRDTKLRYNSVLGVFLLDALGTAAFINTGTTSGTIPLVGTQSATTSLAGLAPLATQTEVNTGTDANKIVTSSTLLNASGRCIQFQSSLLTTQTSTAVPIAAGSSKPAITEGAEFTTLAFTPKLTTSTLKITLIGSLGGNAFGTGCIALFVDTTSAALAAMPIMLGMVSSGAVTSNNVTLTYLVPSASLSARTYRMRYGTSNGSCYINSNAGITNLYGGSIFSGITIEEFA